jgi:desulfoferrodoxin (superoxide reductase-like protein)
MPGYAGVGQAKLLHENSQVFLWQNDTVAASAVVGSLSLAVQLERVRSVHYPWGFSVEVAFSGDPGVFEVDVMVADTDTPNHYIQWTNITQVNATNVGRVDVLNSWAKYVALYMKTLPNAVTVTGQITR